MLALSRPRRAIFISTLRCCADSGQTKISWSWVRTACFLHRVPLLTLACLLRFCGHIQLLLSGKLFRYRTSECRASRVCSLTVNWPACVNSSIVGDFYDGFRTDIWAMGVTLFALAFGVVPFSDEVSESVREAARGLLFQCRTHSSQGTRAVCALPAADQQCARAVRQDSGGSVSAHCVCTAHSPIT